MENYARLFGYGSVQSVLSTVKPSANNVIKTSHFVTFSILRNILSFLSLYAYGNKLIMALRLQ